MYFSEKRENLDGRLVRVWKNYTRIVINELGNNMQHSRSFMRCLALEKPYHSNVHRLIDCCRHQLVVVVVVVVAAAVVVYREPHQSDVRSFGGHQRDSTPSKHRPRRRSPADSIFVI